MNYLKSITLTQFKNYTHRSFAFEDKIIAVTGHNGSGKTNLLDALYYLCFTKSYFQSKEMYNIQSGKEGFRLEGDFLTEDGLHKVVCVLKEGKKQVSDNDVIYEKLSQHIGKYTAVMIAPDDSRIVTEGGEYRRKFMDGILSQFDQEYLDRLLQYQKVLAQKNAYLKNAFTGYVDRSLIQVYNEQLYQSGIYLIEKRRELTDIFTPLVQEFYHELCRDKEQIGITYTPDAEAEQWLALQVRTADRELQAGRTLVGPHLDDWEMKINGISFKAQASQGQKKSMLIAMKIAQLQILTKKGRNPLLLLDDIFEKLDKSRLEQLFIMLSKMDLAQVFLTHTGAEDVRSTIIPYFSSLQVIEL